MVDPFINACWGLFAIDYDEDDEPYVYFVNALISREIPFLVSPDAAERFQDWDADWSCVSKKYRSDMQKRVRKAAR